MTAVPSAQGSLQQTPLLHLLVYALDKRLGGTLVLEDPDHRKHAILFEEGAPTKARPAEPKKRLGDLLVEAGRCSKADVNAAVERAKSEKRLMGEVLLEAHALAEEALQSALSEQVSRNVLELCSLAPQTAFGYYDGINYLERWAGNGAPARPLALIWRVTQAHTDPQQVAQFLGRLGDGPLRLHYRAPVSALGLSSRAQAVVDVLRAKPQPLAELIGRELCDLETTRRLVYTLLLLRHLELPGASPPIGLDHGVSPRPPSVPPPPRATPPRNPLRATPAQSPLRATPAQSPLRATPAQAPRVTPAQAPAASGKSPAEVEALRAELKRRAESTSTYYDLLGIPADAPAGAIQSAFFQLAKVWHPDRLPAELKDVRDVASHVFSRMSEAHQTLSDPERRKEYDKKSAEGGDDAAEQEQVQRVLRAHTAYQKALVLMKRHAMPAAETEARHAMEEDPEQADYLGLVAWIESQKPGVALDGVVRDLDRAVKMEENNLRVRWFRGQIYKRLGRDARAASDFRFILERDPKHVDAQREMRLYEMRKGQGSKSDPPPADKSGGVFGRLFKKS